MRLLLEHSTGVEVTLTVPAFMVPSQGDRINWKEGGVDVTGTVEYRHWDMAQPDLLFLAMVDVEYDPPRE